MITDYDHTLEVSRGRIYAYTKECFLLTEFIICWISPVYFLTHHYWSANNKNHMPIKKTARVYMMAMITDDDDENVDVGTEWPTCTVAMLMSDCYVLFLFKAYLWISLCI